MGKREGIGGGTGGHEEYRDLGLEQFADPPLDRPGQRVVAVAERKALIGAVQRRKDARRDGGGIVACEIHRKGSRKFSRQR